MHHPISPLRGLSHDAENAFLSAYRSLTIFEGESPQIRFSREAAETFRQISELRRKNWRTSTPWNEAAESTGLIGEIAIQFYLGISADRAMADFKTGLMGDLGHDVEVAGLKLDVKSTRGSAVRYKFSKTNPRAHRSDGFIFAFVEDAGLETWVHILGYAYRADVRPYLRDDGQRWFVRAETLRREGVIRTVSQLRRTEQNTERNPHVHQ